MSLTVYDTNMQTKHIGTSGKGTEEDPLLLVVDQSGVKDSDILLPSAARAAAVSSAKFSAAGTGVHVLLDVTAIPAGSITATIEGLAPDGLSYYPLLVSVPITAVGLHILKLFFGATPSPNKVANDKLPSHWRVSVAVADASAITYSISANYL